ncbi:MAG: multidrug effflux MFS transporter [Novosphingobium sp.]|nr:multidrug effflux MFS transporter [Novosphingobium sp.]
MTASPQVPPSFLGDREFVTMMALVAALQALAIDSMLPALGVIANDLRISDPNDRQLVIAVFLFGIGLGSIFPGAISDRFGRKPVLLACLAGYILPSFACAFATDINILLILRAVQAVCSGGLAVMPAAIIRDRVSGDRMARLQSLISMIFMAVPMIAPTLGQGVLMLLGWRWIFAVMGVLGMAIALWVMARLPETLNPAYRQPIALGRVFGNMGTVLTRRESIGYILASALTMAGTWGFINSSQQLIAEHFGAGDAFPLIFGMMALGMALASFTNSRIVERFGARRVSHTALFVYIAAAAGQVWLALSGHITLWQFVPLMALNMGLLGFLGANFQSIALQPFGEIAGAAASVQTFVRTLTAGVLGAMVGQAYDGTSRPLAAALLMAGVFSLALILFSERGVLFRRLYPRGMPRPEP